MCLLGACGRLSLEVQKDSAFAVADGVRSDASQDADALTATLSMHMDTFGAGCIIPIEPTTATVCPLGDPGLVTGQVNNGYQLFGHPIVMQRTDLLSGSAFSISIWINVSDTPRFQSVASQSVSDTSIDNTFLLGVRADKSVFVGFVEFGTAKSLEAGSIGLGQWTHFAVVSGNDTLSVYRNGTIALSYFNAIDMSSRRFVVGGDEDRGVVANTYLGSVDELRIFDRVLSEPEIIALSMEKR
jgi:hypothetical protein